MRINEFTNFKQISFIQLTEIALMLVTGSQAVLACTIINGWMILTYEWEFGVER
jgi:hypothetical protein